LSTFVISSGYSQLAGSGTGEAGAPGFRMTRIRGAYRHCLELLNLLSRSGLLEGDLEFRSRPATLEPDLPERKASVKKCAKQMRDPVRARSDFSKRQEPRRL
jgi:hypothetical protein